MTPPSSQTMLPIWRSTLRHLRMSRDISLWCHCRRWMMIQVTMTWSYRPTQSWQQAPLAAQSYSQLLRQTHSHSATMTMTTMLHSGDSTTEVRWDRSTCFLQTIAMMMKCMIRSGVIAVRWWCRERRGGGCQLRLTWMNSLLIDELELNTCDEMQCGY